MKYKLIKPVNNNYSALQQVLTNRGISVEDISHYINTTDEDINSYLLFGEDKLKEAATAIIDTIRKGLNAIVIVDADCDGMTSAATIINYLHNLFPSWVENHLCWFIHEGKQHGLSDCCDFIIENGFSLCLVPDAGR
jgi:single-stranded DNA-specific DHH superfamily exonuclease